MSNHKSPDVRKLAIEYYFENDVSQSQISKMFKITDRTFRNQLKNYYENNTIDRLPRNAESYKIKQRHVNYILKLIKSNPTWSVKMLWTNMNSKFNDFKYPKVILQELYGKIILQENVIV